MLHILKSEITPANHAEASHSLEGKEVLQIKRSRTDFGHYNERKNDKEESAPNPEDAIDWTFGVISNEVLSPA